MKRKTPSRPSSKPRRAAPTEALRSRVFKLPSLKVFASMPLLARTKLFRDWAATKDPLDTYLAHNSHGCSLDQFGRAMGAKPEDSYGLLTAFVAGNKAYDVIANKAEYYEIVMPRGEHSPYTFGHLVARLDAHIAEQEAKLD